MTDHCSLATKAISLSSIMTLAKTLWSSDWTIPVVTADSNLINYPRTSLSGLAKNGVFWSESAVSWSKTHLPIAFSYEPKSSVLAAGSGTSDLSQVGPAGFLLFLCHIRRWRIRKVIINPLCPKTRSSHSPECLGQQWSAFLGEGRLSPKLKLPWDQFVSERQFNDLRLFQGMHCT